MTAKQIFNDALDRPVEEREAFLREACGDDDALRADVAGLLRAHVDAERFLVSTVDHVPGDGANGDRQRREVPVPAEIVKPGTVLGPYRIVRPLGEGGFGAVFLAEQTQPIRRQVALKIIKLGMNTRQVIARFEAERQALAIMEHPGIASLYDAGSTAQGRPYFVMEYVKGETVTAYCDRNTLTVEERLHLFEQVCHAVHHAHQNGVIHRDLKPNNILVAVVDGKALPKVIDFGIAKSTALCADDKGEQLGESIHAQLTQEHQLIGTPEFMSPEQASLNHADVDTRSDIYSLGILLYELLAGRSPYDAQRLARASLRELEQIICEEQPPPPSARLGEPGTAADGLGEARRTSFAQLYRRLRGELDWVVMRAIEKNPDRRYPTVYALAADIRRYLDHEPVDAGPPSQLYRLRKFYGRHRPLAIAAMTVAAVLVIATVVSLIFGFGAVSARNDALAHQTAAELARDQSQDSLWQSHQAHARAAGYSRVPGRRAESIQAVRDAAEIRPDACLRNIAIMSSALFDIEPYRTFEHTGWGSAEGLATIDRVGLGDDNGLVVIRAIDDGSTIATLQGPPLKVHTTVFSPDGRYVAVKYILQGDDVMIVWDIESQTRVLEVPLDGGAVAFDTGSAGPRWFAVSQRDGRQHVYDLPSGDERFSFPRHDRAVCSAVDPSGRMLSIGGAYDRLIEIWDIEKQTQLAVHEVPAGILDMGWRPDGEQLAVAGADRVTYLVDPDDGLIEGTLVGHQAAVVEACWVDDNILVTNGWDATVRFWDVSTGQEVLRPLGAPRLVGVADKMVTAEPDRVDVWRIDYSEIYSAFATREASTGHDRIVLHPDGRHLIAAHRDSGVTMWDIHEGRLVDVIDDRRAPWCDLAPDGSALITPHDEEVTLRSISLDPDSGVPSFGPPRAIWTGPDSWRARTDPTGRYLAPCGRDGLSIIDIATGERIFEGEGYKGITEPSMSYDGRYAFTGTWKGDPARIWNLETGEVEATFPGLHVIGRFSPAGDRLVVTWGDRAEILRYGDWSEVATIERNYHGDLAAPVVFTADGSLAVMKDAVITLILIDPRTGENLASLPSPRQSAPSAVELGSDGDLLIVGSRDPVIEVWDIARIRRELGTMNLDW